VPLCLCGNPFFSGKEKLRLKDDYRLGNDYQLPMKKVVSNDDLFLLPEKTLCLSALVATIFSGKRKIRVKVKFRIA
jgi:hypothetical protein